MIENMSQEQQWGLAYLLQLYNGNVARMNAGLEQRNQFKTRDQPLEEAKPLLDLEQFATLKLSELAVQGYNQLISFKEQEALRLFRLKSPEEQAALVAQLQIPDVLV